MTPEEAKNFIKNHLTGWRTFNSQNLALLNSEDRLVRALPDVREHQFYPIARYLQQHADPKNADKSAVVVDPEVDDQPAKGTWRHVSCYLVRTDARGNQAQDGKHFSLVQELRRGFLNTLDYSEARLVQTDIGPGSGASPNANKEKTFTLQWKAVDPDQMESLADGKAIVAQVATPKHRRAIVAEGEDATVDLDVTGLDVRTHSVSTGIDEDGTGTVTVRLGDSRFELVGFANWLGSRQSKTTYIYDIPEQLAQGIIDVQKDRGVDVTVSSWQNGLVSIRVTEMDLTGVTLSEVKVREDCDSTEYASFYWAGSDETSLPIPSPVPAGTSYRRSVNENGDGSFSVSLIKRVRKHRALAEYTSEHRADQTAARKEWKGVTDQDIAADLAAQSGKVVRVRRERRDDCSEDVDRETITPVNQTATSYERSSVESSQTVLNTQADTAAAGPITPGAGTIKRVENVPTRFGKFRTQVRTSSNVSTDTGWFSAGENRAGGIMRRVATGQTQASAESIAGSSPGSVYYTSGSVSGPDRYGTYSAMVTATSRPVDVGARKPYDDYEFAAAGSRTQYRTKDGKTQKRTVTLTYYYAGNTSETSVKNYVAGSDREGVRITPNGTGTYFQGYSYKVTGVVAPGWVDDDDEA